jgi:hypothetical protein
MSHKSELPSRHSKKRKYDPSYDLYSMHPKAKPFSPRKTPFAIIKLWKKLFLGLSQRGYCGQNM